MEQKKIATSVDIMIKVAQYEYIHVTKYSEKNISYENKDEMVSKEDELSKELVNDVVRTLRGIPDQLGQGKKAVTEIEEKIKTRIPEWLGNDPEPNIANNPSSVANTAKNNNDKAEAEIQAKSEEKQEKVNRESAIVENLFDDEPAKDEKTQTPAQESVTNVEESVKKDAAKDSDIDVAKELFGEDLFADDADLFNNK